MGSDRVAGTRVFQIDAFTSEKFTGNPAGVVPNADHLSVTDMQRIAREMNNSETAFILKPQDAGHDVWVRFFTPTTEVPNCGHATLSAHFVLAHLRGGSPATLVQKTGAGVMPVSVEQDEHGLLIKITQGKPEISEPLSAGEVRSICEALGITDAERNLHLPLKISSTGHSKVMVPLNSIDCLAGLNPDLSALSRISAEIGCNGYFAFVLADDTDNRYLSTGRMFAPAIGINEDPVTGNANGPLGAYLVNEGHFGKESGIFTFWASQGGYMGRPGEMQVTVTSDNGVPTKVVIAGRAVTVFDTTL